ncbi:MAG: hypothetical protein JWQ89_1547 [Devosia sp.]|uniref:CHRD domain-containing protein n=1 Tax=Devosia sp. TaxID=1871048 RepID=UPI002624B170|nr:CHRD domain-containing protein [Devosia sp.]MDB5539820.1 hypothetical protein [Devosia sp.]
MHLNLKPSVIAATAVLAVSMTAAGAAPVTFTADLNGAAAVPPTDSTGTGKLEATYDNATGLFTWNVTYQGLSGDVTGAQFHGPAAAGESAPVVLPVQQRLRNPIAGNASLSNTQLDQLRAGQWYFNIVTAKFRNGEIRGQVMPAAN